MRMPGNHELCFPFDEGGVPRLATAQAEMIESASRVIRHFLVQPAQRDVTEYNAVGSIPKSWLLNYLGQPRCLFATQCIEGDASTETGMIVRFIFAGVQADRGQGSSPKGIEVTVVRRSDHSRHIVRMRAPHIMISPRE